MAILGWLLVTLGGAFFGFGGVVLLFVGSQFSGRFCFEAFIPMTIGAVLLYASYTNVPFKVIAL